MSEEVKSIGIDSTPRLMVGSRLHPTENLLLVPEGALQLSGPAKDILAMVDGKRTVSVIVDELLAQYAGAERHEIQQDVLALLGRMQQRGVIRG